MISFDDFKKVKLQVGIIKSVEEHPDADRLYIVKIDIGGEEKQAVAGVREYYAKEDLLGRQVAVVANMEPAKIRGVESQVMILAAKDDEKLAVIVPDKEVSSGSQIL